LFVYLARIYRWCCICTYGFLFFFLVFAKGLKSAWGLWHCIRSDYSLERRLIQIFFFFFTITQSLISCFSVENEETVKYLATVYANNHPKMHLGDTGCSSNGQGTTFEFYNCLSGLSQMSAVEKIPIINGLLFWCSVSNIPGGVMRAAERQSHLGSMKVSLSTLFPWKVLNRLQSHHFIGQRFSVKIGRFKNDLAACLKEIN